MGSEKELKEAKAREILIGTIAKIYDLEPALGGKWRLGMLRHYSNTLAE